MAIKLRANERIALALLDALEHLDKFNRPDDPGCGVKAEVREEARLYLDTWVAADLRSALRDMLGDRSAASDLEASSWSHSKLKARLVELAREVQS